MPPAADLAESSIKVERASVVMSTHASVLVDSVVSLSTDVCKTAASFS
jgi:hypothetical protein